MQAMTPAELTARLDQAGQLGPGDIEGADRAVGEGREAAVGIEQDPLRSEQRDGTLGPGHDLLGCLDARRLLVDDAHADAGVAGQLFQDLELSGPRRAQLEEERADREGRQEGDQRRVIAGQGGRLVAGPVAPADVEGQPVAGKPVQRLAQQRPSEGELLPGAPLLTQGATHERAIALRLPPVDHLGQHGLIELHDRRTGRNQGLDLLAKHPDHVFAERLSRLVGAIGDALQPHRPREQVGTGQCHLDGPIGQPPDRGQLVHGQGPRRDREPVVRRRRDGGRTRPGRRAPAAPARTRRDARRRAAGRRSG